MLLASFFYTLNIFFSCTVGKPSPGRSPEQQPAKGRTGKAPADAPAGKGEKTKKRTAEGVDNC